MDIEPFKLERYFAEHEFRTEHLLCSSDCQSMTIEELLAFEPRARERFLRTWLGYTESRGSPALRQQIGGIYDSVTPDQVLVHAGAEEAIALFMHAALRRGDQLIVHWPCYQSLAEVARAMGCRVTRWIAREENGWAPDPDELARLITRRTRVIVLNSPHNPTGYLMPEAVFREVNRTADAHGITLFSDEVYRESEQNAADRLPAACDVSGRAVSLGVMSKTYGLAGLRVGWIATKNREIYEKMEALKDYSTICTSAPSEFLAELALRHRAALIARSLDLLTRNLDVLDGFFARHTGRFVWRRPKAGSIAFPRLLGDEVEAFCSRLVRQAGVLLLPGTVYADRDNHFRVGFGRAGLPQAVARLEEWLRRGA